MNKNNLNRIKGILSAKQGTQIPKFQGGAKFVKQRGNNRLIYSADGINWFYDQNLTQSFDGNLEKYDNEFQIGTENSVSAGVNFMTQDQIDDINKKNMKAGNAAQFAGQALQTVGDAFGAKQMATDSDTTKTVDQMYDGAASAISNFGPWGKVIGTAMQAAGAVGDIAQSMGGGTDQQTKLDQWMDSSFLSWNVGMINGFFGKNTDSFGIDQETLSAVGGSYGGTANSISEAAKSADKEYGLFSSKARKKANDAINKAKQQQNLMGDIADQASDQRLAVQSMGEQAGLAYSLMTNGGYDQKYTYAAKEGGVLEWNPNLSLNWEPQIELNWELPVFKEGGNINITEELEWIPELQKNDKITSEELINKEYPPEYLEFKNSLPDNHKYTPENEYRMYKYWQLWGKPKNFEYTLNNPNEDGEYMFNWDKSDKSYHGSSIAWGNDGIGYFIKPKHHDTIQYELDYYNDGTITKEGGKQRKPNKKERESWEEFRKNYILEDDGDFYKYVPVKQVLQDLEISQQKYLKEGGSLGDIPEIEETNQKNVIPEGALHKNKHHMEHAEKLTKKGIPVIDEEGEQQAEIEHSEIIFTLEVTKKLEEYYQIFYSEESTNKEKEQAALDAGKLLVYQILENTEDRTGLIESCKQGGTLKKSEKLKTDFFNEDQIKNIIKEAFLELLIK